MLKNNFTILVNSSDGFEDCWDPFFTLFSKYWPEYKGKIILNTEFKDYKFKGLDITCAKSNWDSPDKKLTWSECLINALKTIETPLVLYLQEDYFIDKPVNNNFIIEVAELMTNYQKIKYIGLTDSGNYPPFYIWEKDKRLLQVSNNSKYRISTQAGLWDTLTLISYLKPTENGWMFEIFGTQRAKKKKELFLTINRELFSYSTNPIIAYIHTGIIKGKWHKKIPQLFEENNIKVDFSQRGYYSEKHWILRKIETTRKLLKNPIVFIRGMLDL